MPAGRGFGDPRLGPFQCHLVHGQEATLAVGWTPPSFDYDLPSELIAQHPTERRDASRLLVYDRATGATRHRRFADLPEELSGQLAVVNDTRVVPARIRIEQPKGEVLLLEHQGEGERLSALARPTRRLKAGRPVRLRRAAGAPGRGALAGAARRRAGRGDAAAALHHRAARGSLPLPDRLRGRGRLRSRSHGRPALHAGLPRPARGRARHAPRRSRHVPPARDGHARGARAARRALRGPPRGVGADRSGRPRPGRRYDHGARARDGGKQQTVTRPDVVVRHARLRVRAGRRAADQLPPARARRCSRS